MNRTDLQQLSNTRIREAQILFAANEYSGAYYLSGYAVECALKACFARNVKRHDFPDRDGARKVFTHNLIELAKLALLEDEFEQAQDEPSFASNWRLVRRWTEESRYSVWSSKQADQMLDAIINQNFGVLPWIQRRW